MNFVQISAIGANEDSSSNYARTKALGEASVLKYFPEATILRPSIIFGAEDQFFNGRRYQQILHHIRKDGEDGRLALGDIYGQHPELWMWWNRPDRKHNQR